MSRWCPMTLLSLLACTGSTGKDVHDCPTADDSNKPGDDTAISADDSSNPGTFDPANFANFTGDQVDFFTLTPENAACTLRFGLSGTVVVQQDCEGCEFTINLVVTFDQAHSTVDTATCGPYAVGGSGTLAYHPDFDGLGPALVFPGQTPILYGSAQLSADYIRFGYGNPSMPPNAFSASPAEMSPASLGLTLNELLVGEMRPN